MHVHQSGYIHKYRFSILVVIGLLIFAGCIIGSPASAEVGYTQKLMGSPQWMLEKGPTPSFEPKLFRGAELMVNMNYITTGYVNAGKEHLIAGSFIDAKTSFDSALGRDVELFDGWLGRGIALESLKRYQSAYESYDTAIRLYPIHPYAYLAYAGKGRSALETQRYEEASVLFATAISLYDKFSPHDSVYSGFLVAGLAEANENLSKGKNSDDMVGIRGLGV